MWLMRLGKYLSSLTKPELDELIKICNLTDDEEMIFMQLSKGRSKIMAADNCMVSLSFVDSRIKSISAKINRLGCGAIGKLDS